MTIRTISLSILTLTLAACTTATSDTTSDTPYVKLVQTVFDVDSTGWKTYKNDAWHFSLKYPETFVVEETPDMVIIRRDVATTSDKIEITRQKTTTLKKAASDVIRGSMRIDDMGAPEHTATRIAHFFSGDALSWFMTYYIAHEDTAPQFPGDEEAADASYDVIVADVDAFPDEAQFSEAIREYNMAGPNIFLIPFPFQIDTGLVIHENNERDRTRS